MCPISNLVRQPNIYAPRRFKPCLMEPVCNKISLSSIETVQRGLNAISNFGDRRCGLFLNISRVPCQVLEAIGMPGMQGLRGKEREQRPTNHRTCFDNHPTLNPVCLHHMTFHSVHLDKIKVTLVTTEAERHASTGSLH